MPDNFDPEGYSLEDMNEEQKDALILNLATEYNQQLMMNAEQHNIMVVLADRLLAYNRVGSRARVIADVAQAMQMIAAITRMRMGVDLVQQQVDSTFEDIVAGLEFQEPHDDE